MEALPQKEKENQGSGDDHNFPFFLTEAEASGRQPKFAYNTEPTDSQSSSVSARHKLNHYLLLYIPTSKFKASPPLLFPFLLNMLVKFSKCLINNEVAKGKFYHGRQYVCPGKISVSFCKNNGLLNKVNSILIFLPQKQSPERLE